MSKQNLCRFCREPLPPRAVYCTKCSNFQDWRRFFSVSSVVLSLLIALLSVLSTGGPTIVRVLTPNRSRIEIKAAYLSNTGLNVVVSNTGNRPGFIVAAKFVIYDTNIHYPSVKEPWGWGFILPLGTTGEDSSDRIVNGGEVKSVTFAPDLSLLVTQLKRYPNNSLFQAVNQLTIEFTAWLKICQFDGTQQEIQVPIQQTGLVSPELESTTSTPIFEYFYPVIYEALGNYP